MRVLIQKYTKYDCLELKTDYFKGYFFTFAIVPEENWSCNTLYKDIEKNLKRTTY